MPRFSEWPSRLQHFLRVGLWQAAPADRPLVLTFFLKTLRVLLSSLRGFTESRCTLHASALTFYSLLSIVPVLAMGFGIAKGFGFERRLERELLHNFAGQEQVLSRMIGFARNLLENTQGGMIAGIGIVILFWTVMKLMGSIEASFNDIWRVKRERRWVRKISDYLTLMLISPVLVLLSSSVTLFITAEVTEITEKVRLLGYLSPMISFFLQLLPYGLIWMLFILLYLIMPNTRVNLLSGIIAGVIAGTAYNVVQWGYIFFQVGIARYNAIYGSFAALPLFLFWLQVSWLIVLFGAVLAHAHQHIETLVYDPEQVEISHRQVQLLSLQVAHLVVGRFQRGEEALTAAQAAERLHLPVGLTRRLMKTLQAARIFSSIRGSEAQEPAYQPASAIERLSVKTVLDAVDSHGDVNPPPAGTDVVRALAASLDAFSKTIEASPQNRLLRDI
jgi:membrane protein